MSHMNPSATLNAGSMGLRSPRLYIASLCLIAGNVILPALAHHIPGGGPALMPLFFFTLIAGWEFGLSCALLTALGSPLISFALTGMPRPSALMGVILSSMALGLLAVVFSPLFSKGRSRGGVATWGVRLVSLAAIVAMHQALLMGLALSNGLDPALKGLVMRLPGALLQILGGCAVIGLMERFISRDAQR
ncbi:MAG TPA: hypothetical protein PKL14_05555 [Holophaga sp.]|nr:hypothetical protein [Holophaga sp.]